jgi:hypothetical protein
LRDAAGSWLARRLGKHLAWELAQETKLVISVAIRTAKVTGRGRGDVTAKPWRDDHPPDHSGHTDQRASDDDKVLHLVPCCLHHRAGQLQSVDLARPPNNAVRQATWEGRGHWHRSPKRPGLCYMPGMTTFGFTPRDAARLRRLTPEWRIQQFLDDTTSDIAGAACRSPRRVLRERTAQCLDGALFAAAALRLQGQRPLIMDLEAERDDDHVVAVFQRHGHWGAIARSNFSGLRFREPVFRSLRELALSYFESYFNLRREKTLRRYSVAVDLSRFDAHQWMTSEDDQWEIGAHLVHVRHFALLTPAIERALGRVDRRLFAAGKLGRQVSSTGSSA